MYFTVSNLHHTLPTSFVYYTAQKKQQRILLLSVGVARLERATACTPCKNASQLHHTPIAFAAAKIRMFFELMFTFRKKSYLCTK